MHRPVFAATLSLVLVLDAAACRLVPFAQADEQVPAAPSGTNLRGTDATETSDTILTFDCSFALEGRPPVLDYRKITCRFATTGIARPTSKQLAERLSEFDEQAYQKELRGKFPKLCKEVTPEKAKRAGAALAGALRTQYEMLVQACARQDPAAAIAALRYGISEVWANTCKVFNYGARQYEFRKVDESTWRGMDNAVSDGSATMKTIWRKKVTETFAPWNYKQVTSADPRCVPERFHPCSTDGTDEWTFDARSKLTGCRYFE